EATKLKREKAKEAVQPVMIRQGQIIVQEGQVINKEIFEQLQVVGLLDDSFNVYPYIGLFILIVFLTGFLAYFIEDSAVRKRNRIRYYLLYTTIFFITVFAFKLVSLTTELINGVHYLLPAA